jgi:hypothetical protein
MVGAAVALSVGLGAMTWISIAVPVGPSYWHMLLAGWVVLGIAYSMSVTPSGRLLKRSANAEDRPALFAAQFALSHICWLICYPLVGQLGANISMTAAFGAMAIFASAARFCLVILAVDDPMSCRTSMTIYRRIMSIFVYIIRATVPHTPI